MLAARRTALIFVVIAACAIGGSRSVRAGSELSPELRADISRLIEVSGASGLGVQMGEALVAQMASSLKRTQPDVPERAIEILIDVVSGKLAERDALLLERLAPLCAEHFTHDEIKQLTVFYSGPLGQKLVAELPPLMHDTLQVGQEWAGEVMPEVREELERRFSEEAILEPPSDE